MELQMFESIENVLSPAGLDSFETSWEEQFRKPSLKHGGIWEFMSFKFGSPKDVEIGTRKFYYWMLPTRKTVCALAYKKHGPVAEDIYFFVPKDSNENDALGDWKDFISQLEVN